MQYSANPTAWWPGQVKVWVGQVDFYKIVSQFNPGVWSEANLACEANVWDWWKLAWSCKQYRLLSQKDLWQFGNPEYLKVNYAGLSSSLTLQVALFLISWNQSPQLTHRLRLHLDTSVF